MPILKEHMDSSRDDFQHETGWYFSAGSILTGWCPSHSSHNQCSTLSQPPAPSTAHSSCVWQDVCSRQQGWRAALHKHLLQPQPVQLLDRTSSLHNMLRRRTTAPFPFFSRLTNHTPILQSLVSALLLPLKSVELCSCFCLCGCWLLR